jgi:hypothetical protein
MTKHAETVIEALKTFIQFLKKSFKDFFDIFFLLIVFRILIPNID